MYYKFNYLFHAIIFFINIKYLKTFNVNFHYNYNLQVETFNTHIYKREVTQFLDEASFAFNGFQKVESIPVRFPIDICIFSLNGSRYATTLHMTRNGARHMGVLKTNNGSYEVIADIPSPNVIAIDCITYNNKGYIATALNLTDQVQYAKEGSAIYEVNGKNARAIQYFAAPNITSVYLHASGNDVFLLHTYANSHDRTKMYCPYYKWSGSSFNKIGRIPCSNARQLAPFSIDYESYVAVANYADEHGRTFINSEIYKYSRDKKKFLLFQKIQTNGAVDVQYFNVPQNEIKRQHFLIIANSLKTDSFVREDNNLEADSVFYVFDKGQFIPYQKLSLYAVQKFLPVQSVEAEKFILLVACADQDIKVYNFNDWRFEESKVQFTEGALSKGVSNMRMFYENEKSYLIIANNLMADNETNIFLPIFKQEQHANALRQNIIDWAKAETHRLKTTNTKILGAKVEEKLRNLSKMKYFPNMQDISGANIHSVTTKMLLYPKFKMTSDYWLALDYINQALDALEIMLKQKQRLKRNTLSPSDSYENLEYFYDSLNVKTLTVKKQLKADKVNRIKSSQPEFENIKARKITVKDKFTKSTPVENNNYKNQNDTITFKNINIKGKLNKYLWRDLYNNTLKRQAQKQFLNTHIEIETLKTYGILLDKNIINEESLDALIPIDGGKYVINQHINFASPITVNQLKILERLNNLHVFDGQFDVVLKKSNKTQIIQGLKNLTHIKIMEPIKIAGVNKFINEPLVIQGNVMIEGDTLINKTLNTSDFMDLHEQLSANQILDMGIRMDKSLKGINIRFQQPLTANYSVVSFVNHYDVQRLVKLTQDIQIIEGLKVFNDSLVIKNGFIDVKNLNKIDVEELERNAFLKNNNQTIKIPIKIGKIQAQSVRSPVIILNNKNLTDYLTITGNQSIQGSLILENLKAKSLTMEHLNTDSEIFQQNLQNIYQQKARNASRQDVLKKNLKFHGSIYVQNLLLNATINNMPIDVIENQILKLKGNIKFEGDFKFNYPMNVINMTFKGKLNGIHAEEFGKCWLQKNAVNQVFTAAQTFAIINAQGGIQMQGNLNGFAMEDFYTKTYRINRNEYIPCANFENPLEITTHLITRTLNDYLVPHDMICKSYKERPITLTSMNVGENVRIDGSIHNLISINNIKLYDLQWFLDSTTEQALYVENAYFAHSPPLYKSLNSHHIRKTLDSVWLANENVVLPQYIEITHANFDGLMEFYGTINDIDVDYLRQNYFSKSKPQNISVEMLFSGGAEGEKAILLNDLHVFGVITEAMSILRKYAESSGKGNGRSFDFNEFVQYTVKNVGQHVISAKWSLLEALVEGNLNDVQINKLNLVDDILHKVKYAHGSQVKAPKTFKNVNIENMYADASSLVNEVPIANWINDAVYLYDNYTIKGVATLDYINIYNNLIIAGKLNNITYNEHNILLRNKNQQIAGSVKIISHLPQEDRFVTNTIEYLYSGYINEQYMPKFAEDIIQRTETTEIKTHLIFKYSLGVEEYHGPEEFLTQNQRTKRIINDHDQLNRQNVHRAAAILKEFEEMKGLLFNVTKNNIYKLDHFDVLQTIKTNFSELSMFSLKFDNLIVDILAVPDSQDEKVTIYKWIPKEKKFRITKEFDWLPHDPLLLKIIHKQFTMLQQPIEYKTLKTLVNEDLKIFRNVLSKANDVNNYFEFFNQTCMVFQSNVVKSMELNIFCLNNQSTEQMIVFNNKVQQIISFEQKYIALLTNSSVLIYDISVNSKKMLHNITLTTSKQMALASFKNYKFLAVLNYGKSSTLNNGFIGIYRSVNSSAFTFFQFLACPKPSKMTFSFFEKSTDLLLHVLTNSVTAPYRIYQYKGVMGFREILSDSVLSPNSFGFNILNLYSSKQYLVALNCKDNITLVELSLNQI